MFSDELFNRCSSINDLINQKKEDEARDSLIQLLGDIKGHNCSYPSVLNHLIREVGLYPYLDIEHSDWQDRFACEAFRTDIGGDKSAVLHLEQSHVLKELLEGKSVAVSAPTSFGKSFIIDSFIALKSPNVVVIIVPTVALADETRRRINKKFGRQYKVITTTDSSVNDKTIFIFPQERAFAYIDVLSSIDVLIVDEFYKASASFDDQRSESLLQAMIELGKKAKQRYYLAPNIDGLSDNVFTEGMHFLRIKFNTVITKYYSLYKNMGTNKSLKDFKAKELRKIINSDLGKTLIYAGSYNGIEEVCKIMSSDLADRRESLLEDFSDWLSVNYGSKFQLKSLVKRGIGIHNGRLHRSLGQIQVKLFEEERGLNYIISTSSIIEGVNTQAENVILWSNKNGRTKLNYFTYRNIAGRAGRMFKYFVGKIYALEEPPSQTNTNLTLDFPDDVVKSLDGINPGIELNNEQYKTLKSFNDEMDNLLGHTVWNELRSIPEIKMSNPEKIKELCSLIIKNYSWPRNIDALTQEDTFLWREPLKDILKFESYRDINRLCTFIGIDKNAWHSSIPVIYSKVSKYKISYNDMFAFERYMSFNLSSTLSLINKIRQTIYPNSVDISNFIHRISNCFLPKLVYELEEYGLPRMISRKIQVSGLIDLEDEDKEINTLIKEFLNIGENQLLAGLQQLHPFDKYILDYFYDGISS